MKRKKKKWSISLHTLLFLPNTNKASLIAHLYYMPCSALTCVLAGKRDAKLRWKVLKRQPATETALEWAGSRQAGSQECRRGDTNPSVGFGSSPYTTIHLRGASPILQVTPRVFSSRQRSRPTESLRGQIKTIYITEPVYWRHSKHKHLNCVCFVLMSRSRWEKMSAGAEFFISSIT
jgi:hypothetical protein